MTEVENIFNALDGFSQIVHARHELKEIEQSLFSLKNNCGSCKNWMTSICQREKYHKVKCSEVICGDFKMNSFTSEFIERKTIRKVELESRLTKSICTSEGENQ